MKKKVCIIGTLKFGIGHYIAHIYPELSQEYDLNVLTFTHGSPGDILIMDDDVINKNVPKFRQCINPHGLLESTKSINTLFDIFDAEKFDLLNLHISSYTRKSAYIFIPVIEFFKNKGVKIVYTMHDVLPTPEGGKPTAYLQYYYNLADTAIVGNEQEKYNLQNTFHFHKPISIATHGIYHLFNRKTFTTQQARKILNIPERKKVLLFFGILRDNKGLDDLIRALHELKDNYYLVIAISERLGYSFDEYAKLIDTYSLKNYVKIIRENESNIDKIELYFQNCDVVTLPYTSTSQSGILNLAFAFEKPSIIANVFAESEQVDEKMGFVTEPKNPRMLAEKINKYFESKTMYLPLFKKNIENYNQKTSFEHTAKVYKKVFSKL